MEILSIFYRHKKGGLNKRLYMAYSALTAEHHHVHHIGARPIPVTNSRVSQHMVNAAGSEKENLFFWVRFALSAMFFSFSLARRRRIDLIVSFSPFYTLLSLLPILFCRIPAKTATRSPITRWRAWARC